MKVSIINESNNPLPIYETENSAGMDLRAYLNNIKFTNINNVNNSYNTRITYLCCDVVKTIEIQPGGRCLIPTGLKIALPEGYEAQVRPRSGLALKQGITVLNTPGTLDAKLQ